jgi:hypothetical protein
MICDFVNAIMFSSFSIPCQGRWTRIPHKYKKSPPEGKTNQPANDGLESGAKTTLCQPCFIGHKLQLTQTPDQKVRTVNLLLGCDFPVPDAYLFARVL